MSPENKYIKQIYQMMLNDIDELPNKINWASLVRPLLMSLGFFEVWLNQEVGNIDIFISVFKQRLTDNFFQKWQEKLGISTRDFFTNRLLNFSYSHI